jgi:hypothetical protein
MFFAILDTMILMFFIADESLIRSISGCEHGVDEFDGMGRNFSQTFSAVATLLLPVPVLVGVLLSVTLW